jgi:chitin synthase
VDVLFFTAVYALVMSMVLVATAAQILKSGLLDPSAIFLPTVAIIFMVTGILHPNEMLNLLHGFLYLVTIPGGYLLLVTYAMCNLHVVSWGTRETAEVVKKTGPNNAQGQEQAKPSEKKTCELGTCSCVHIVVRVSCRQHRSEETSNNGRIE